MAKQVDIVALGELLILQKQDKVKTEDGCLSRIRAEKK